MRIVGNDMASNQTNKTNHCEWIAGNFYRELMVLRMGINGTA